MGVSREFFAADFPGWVEFSQGVRRERGAAADPWLAQLPRRLDDFCQQWQLQKDGFPWHGYLGLVFPVLWRGQKAALKLTWVDEETRDEARALQLWKGRGAVALWQAIPEQGVLLLQRVGPQTLMDQPLCEALPIAAQVLRRLALPAPPEFLRLDSYAAQLYRGAQERWQRLGRPFPSEWLQAPPSTRQDLVVNQDLHFANVLQGPGASWLAIDPKVVRGDLEFALAPLIWNRPQEGCAHQRLQQLVQLARLDPELALLWTRFRLLEYWLWALDRGFDQDPLRCQELFEQLTPGR